MALRSITQLKTWFRKGAYPLASQFADWMDSFWHKDETIPIGSVEQLAERLNDKYDATQAKELQRQVSATADKAEALQNDVKTLYTNVNELEDEDERLNSRITSGDEATLQSANGYTDTEIVKERVVRESAERTTLESAKTYADQKIAEVVGSSPEALDTLRELAGALGDDPNFAATTARQIGGKVDKVEGKGLSTEDYTTPEKAKLAAIAEGANNYTHPASHSADTLSEEARAIANESYAEYFAAANLAAWKVWYCLDNDISRFQWADETNGRGVIYRLIDEWQNDCPYDFKNIQFKRYRASATGDLKGTIDGRYYAFRGSMKSVEIEDADDFMWAYTFTLIDDSGQWRDYSVMKDALDAETDWGYFKQFGIGRCEYNHIRNSYTAVTVDEKCYRALMLNNIVLLAGFDDSGLPGEMQLNIFGDGNYNMTLKDDPEQNVFGNKCYGNIVGAYGNTFGNGCSSNTFGNGCSLNTFGNDCYDNTFGNSCSDNTFGNGCSLNTFGNYLYYITVNDGVKYVAVVGGTNVSHVQNAQILNGTSGSNTSNRLQISFKANVKYCQFAGLNSSGILKIWTPADLV